MTIKKQYIYNNEKEFQKHKKEMESKGWDFMYYSSITNMADNEVKSIKNRFPDMIIYEEKWLGKYIQSATYQKIVEGDDIVRENVQ